MAAYWIFSVSGGSETASWTLKFLNLSYTHHEQWLRSKS